MIKYLNIFYLIICNLFSDSEENIENFMPINSFFNSHGKQI
jgi:hypothetical protein